MAQCPKCHTELVDDFGLIECSGCHAPLLIQMDGQVQAMDDGASASPEAMDTPQELVDDPQVFSNDLDSALMSALSGNDSEEAPAEPPFEDPIERPAEMDAAIEDTIAASVETPVEEQFGGEIVHDLEEEPIEIVESTAAVSFPTEAPKEGIELSEDVNEPIEIVADAGKDMPAPVDPDAAAVLATPPSAEELDQFFDDLGPQEPKAPPGPIHDLSQLANTTEAADSAGAFRYTITISGIDTADIRNQFRDLISDRRFLWDADQIVKSIRIGRVRLDDVAAVKALILIQQLRGLPVQVRWEQHAGHQA